MAYNSIAIIFLKLDQRIQNERNPTRVPVDYATVPMCLQRRRSTKVRERKRRRDGIIEHQKSIGHHVSAEIGFPEATIVRHTRGRYILIDEIF